MSHPTSGPANEGYFFLPFFLSFFLSFFFAIVASFRLFVRSSGAGKTLAVVWQTEKQFTRTCRAATAKCPQWNPLWTLPASPLEA